MSSIDKNMGNIAHSCDRRVRVQNTSTAGCNGVIRFYIGSDLILEIKDRYGYINAEEGARIRSAIRAYQSRERSAEEAARRRAEEERRRAEEERRRQEAERRRREEEERRRKEAERVAAYNSLVAAAHSSTTRVADSLNTVTRMRDELLRELNAVETALRGTVYGSDEVAQRIASLATSVRTTFGMLSAEAERKRRRFEAYTQTKNTLTTQEYQRLAAELRGTSTVLDSASFDRSEIAQVREYVKELAAAQRSLSELRKKMQDSVALGGEAGEIARLAVQKIDAVNKSSVQGVLELTESLESVQSRIKECAENARLDELLLRVNEAPVFVDKLDTYIVTSSTYKAVDYRELCDGRIRELERLYAALKEKEHTSATVGELEHIDRLIQQFRSGVADKNMYDALGESVDLIKVIHADDMLNADLFADYDNLKAALERAGKPVPQLRTEDYESQREEMLAEIYEERERFEIELERERIESDRSMLSMGLRNAFAEQGLYFVSGRTAENGLAEENIFAMPGVDDVIIRAAVSDNGFRWSVCGTKKEDGTTVSAERVLEIMRVFDADKKPQKILESLSRSMGITHAKLQGAVDCDSPDALEHIVENGVYDLGESVASDGGAVTAGQILRDISSEFAELAEKNKGAYAARSEGHTAIRGDAGSSLEKFELSCIRDRAKAKRDAVRQAAPRKKVQRSSQRARYMR